MKYILIEMQNKSRIVNYFFKAAALDKFVWRPDNSHCTLEFLGEIIKGFGLGDEMEDLRCFLDPKITDDDETLTIHLRQEINDESFKMKKAS